MRRLRDLPAGVVLFCLAGIGARVPGIMKTTEAAARILAIDGCDVTIRVMCSKGTYIRTLCADIGAALGVGGHLRSLERSRVGPLTLDRALTIGDLVTRQALSILGDDLLSLDQVLQHLPALAVDEQTGSRVRHGVPVPLCGIVQRKPAEDEARNAPGMPIRIHDDGGQLLAIGRLPRQGNETIPQVL